MKNLIFIFALLIAPLVHAEEKKPQPVNIEKVYAMKGQLVTQLEILNAQLQQVNQAINEYLKQQQEKQNINPKK